MKRLLLALVATFVIGTSLVWGQTVQPTFVLDTPVEIPELGMIAAVPSDWVVDGGGDNGYVFAQTQEDFDATTDDDETTIPTGAVYRLIYTPLESLGLEETTSVVEIADQIFAGNLEIAGTLDYGVQGRRAVVYAGTVASGKATYTATWVMNKMVVVVAFGIPDGADINDFGFDFGYFLGSMRVVGFEFLDQDVNDEGNGFTFRLPEDWVFGMYPDLGISRSYALASDKEALEAGNTVFEGAILVTQRLSYDAFRLAADATDTDLATAISAIVNEPVYEGQFYVGGEYAVGISGGATDGTTGQIFVVATLNPETSISTLYVLNAPSQELLDAVLPTYFYILATVAVPTE